MIIIAIMKIGYIMQTLDKTNTKCGGSVTVVMKSSLEFELKAVLKFPHV